jgi:hypothetical protein
LNTSVGYTYYLLINGNVKSTIILNSTSDPQTGTDTSTFIINVGDKISVKAQINPNQKKENHPDDITFVWSIEYNKI